MWALLWRFDDWLERRRHGVPLPPEWDGWTPQQRRAWMRHPMHKRRCWCGAYGLPATDMLALTSDHGQRFLHGEELCQPEREAIR